VTLLKVEAKQVIGGAVIVVTGENADTDTDDDDDDRTATTAAAIKKLLIERPFTTFMVEIGYFVNGGEWDYCVFGWW